MGIVVGVEVVSVSGGLCRAIRIDTHSIIGIDFFLVLPASSKHCMVFEVMSVLYNFGGSPT